MTRTITNFDALATSPLRRDALMIAESAYAAISTERVIHSHVSHEGTMLRIDGTAFDFARFRRVKVFGFGKASCKAVEVIEALLRGRIAEGVAIDVHAGTCDVIAVETGTHPRPSPENVAASERIVAMSASMAADDLVIVVVSGGGSSLLCWPMEECEQGARLYDDFLRVGATIEEMNTVRKHISAVKGGGLAAMLFPATVVGLIFCDVPGGYFEEVASGPTYFDVSTAADAQAILDRYGFRGFVLNETPKEAKYFENVHNIPMVSNTTALEAMERASESLGYTPIRAGDALYDAPQDLVALMRSSRSLGDDQLESTKGRYAVIAGGEPRLVVSAAGGKGGRCQYVSLVALKGMSKHEVFLSFASDGIDNSDAAGAIADACTAEKAAAQGLLADTYLQNFTTYQFFEQTNDLVYTGITNANVSDLFVLLSTHL